jgi:hypothetical protein
MNKIVAVMKYKSIPQMVKSPLSPLNPFFWEGILKFKYISYLKSNESYGKQEMTNHPFRKTNRIYSLIYNHTVQPLQTLELYKNELDRSHQKFRIPQ